MLKIVTTNRKKERKPTKQLDLFGDGSAEWRQRYEPGSVAFKPLAPNRALPEPTGPLRPGDTVYLVHDGGAVEEARFETLDARLGEAVIHLGIMRGGALGVKLRGDCRLPRKSKSFRIWEPQAEQLKAQLLAQKRRR